MRSTDDTATLFSLEGVSGSDQHHFGGIWTEIKLEALKKYLTAFNTALKKQKFSRYYIDAFAGTGRCDIKVDGQTRSIDGSARVALSASPPFHKFYFIELSTRKLSALDELKGEYPNKNIEIIHGDANATLRNICNKCRWKNKRAVLFLDPFGMDVEWATLEVITKTRAIDTWYLFPYAGMYRQAAKSTAALSADKQASLTRVLGTDEWRREFYIPNPQSDLFGDSHDIREAGHRQMLDFVSSRLKILFPAVIGPKVLYQRGAAGEPYGSPLFALYFAASNPNPNAYSLATKIAKDILDTL